MSSWRKVAARGVALAVTVTMLASAPARAERPEWGKDPLSHACADYQYLIGSAQILIKDAIKAGNWEDVTAHLGSLNTWLEAWGSHCQARFGSAIDRAVDETAGGFWDTRESTWGGWAGEANLVLSGDFDGDHRSDLVSLGAGVTDDAVLTLPMAFSVGDGTFQVVSQRGLGTIEPGPYHGPLAWFLHHAAQKNVKKVVGDFNNDGRDDIAVLGGTGWNSVVVAFSNGRNQDGLINWSMTNHQVASDFAGWAADPAAKAVVGNFDGVSGDDIALVGPQHWTSIPLARSDGNGAFSTAAYLPKATTDTNCYAPAPRTNYCPQFLWWAADSQATNPARPTVKPIVGDYNGDGRDDIALVGGQTEWPGIPIAFANVGNGVEVAQVGFIVRNAPNTFAAEARDSSTPWFIPSTVELVAADFNDDGKTDLGAFGTHDPFTNPDTCFSIAQSAVTGPIFNKKHSLVHSVQCQSALLSANVMAHIASARVVTGDFNNDGRDDVVVTGSLNFVVTLFGQTGGGYDYVQKYIS